jgi:amphi-Trp domain-containing protein
MSDVKVELKEILSRDDAAALLSALSQGLGADGHVELPLGASVVTVHVPERVRAEVEVEVEGDEVEVEVEFKWSTVALDAASSADGQAAPRVKAQQRSGVHGSARRSRSLGAGEVQTCVPGANSVTRG